MRLKRALSSLAAATTISVAGIVGLSASPAAAAAADFNYDRPAVGDLDATIDAWKDSRMLGSVTWQADPGSGGTRGDTLCVRDNWSDGRYIVGTTGEGHTASTKGHSSSYNKCVTVNVPEGMPMMMRMTIHGSDGTEQSSPFEIKG
ncbi:hypothetical protein [Streptomyces cucumeris]|uniref:hypothetical protein n=1 Tax=Streptomyces cucumeris TaxID=2962890 RepID=UPI0020C92B92|nr:hypothetical protein [Streptomyces sp. NEAU-Y11]MCP9206954.1 hypothetical protein [Streptomyces sp. NEAU-Y11]